MQIIGVVELCDESNRPVSPPSRGTLSGTLQIVRLEQGVPLVRITKLQVLIGGRWLAVFLDQSPDWSGAGTLRELLVGRGRATAWATPGVSTSGQADVGSAQSENGSVGRLVDIVTEVLQRAVQNAVPEVMGKVLRQITGPPGPETHVDPADGGHE